MNTHTPHATVARAEWPAVNVCANCSGDIMWMDTLRAWIHRNTGQKICDTHRLGGILTIFGRDRRASPRDLDQAIGIPTPFNLNEFRSQPGRGETRQVRRAAWPKRRYPNRTPPDGVDTDLT